jgi:hypothetical protein
MREVRVVFETNPHAETGITQLPLHSQASLSSAYQDWVVPLPRKSMLFRKQGSLPTDYSQHKRSRAQEGR